MLTTNQRIWINIASDHYPSLNEEQVLAMSLKAASQYYLGGDPELVKLFEQYLIFKTLQGDNNVQTK